MPPAIDRCDMIGVAESVERERARQRYDVAAIDQAAAEAVLALGELVEMNARRVLVEPRRHLVLGFLDCHAVDMVDHLADLIIAPAMRAAGEREVITPHDDDRRGFAEAIGLDRLG